MGLAIFAFYRFYAGMTWCVTGNGEARRGEEFVVECKRCWRFVPAGVEEFPRDNIRVDCPLCGEARRYRPSEVYLGYANLAVKKQQVQRAEALRIQRAMHREERKRERRDVQSRE